MLIQGCLNGARPADAHPRLPVTPDQLARDAAACATAGAGEVHVHPRQRDGRESLDPGVVGDAVAAVRRACPGVPVGVTTGAWIVAGSRRAGGAARHLAGPTAGRTA